MILNRRSRLRQLWWTAPLAVLLAAIVVWLSVYPGVPDPWDSTLRSLRSVQVAVPPQSADVTRQEFAARWDSCDGRSGTAGWSDIQVSLTFDTTMTNDAVIAFAEAQLTAVGWNDDGVGAASPLGSVHRWTRDLGGGLTATAGLAPDDRDSSTTSWELHAAAPPHGHRLSGC